jgi:phosphoenolpyruvate synthase/pyruvate phosphate dikinase
MVCKKERLKLEVKEFTKASSLKSLYGKLNSCDVLPLIYFTVKDYSINKKSIILNIKKKFKGSKLIVRSSAKDEDSIYKSNAGKYLSLKNIRLCDVDEAINKVINSYESNDEFNEVLIQPMLNNVIVSGVAFSHDPNTCTPYRVINYSTGNDTSIVTSGSGGKIWIQPAKSINKVKNYQSKIVKIIEELLKIHNNLPIDIEFAITKTENKESVYLLQVRKLILLNISESEEEQFERTKLIYDKIKSSMAPHPLILGETTIFAVMPDWNPAEMIGIRPKPLSLSIYREIITDSIWAYQRSNYGYKNLRGFQLMKTFYGLPYIDTRLSFNSFIPSSLNNKIAQKLINYYLNKFKTHPYLHDKIEFDIVFSCYTLDLTTRINILDEHNFNEVEKISILNSLRKLTNDILDQKKGLINNDYNKLKILETKRNLIVNSKLDYDEKIYLLIEDVKRYGTLPFAGLARAGFISIQFLNSLVSLNIFTEEDYENFMKSIVTESSNLAYDYKILSKDQFLKKYGHLRPGTYDITSPSFDENPDLYFNWDKSKFLDIKDNFSISKYKYKSIDNLLKINKLNITAEELIEFIKNGIKYREYAKFEFTKNISQIFKYIKKIGIANNIPINDLAYINISTLMENRLSAVKMNDKLLNSITLGKVEYDLTLKTSLPPVVSNAEDVWGYHMPEASPNFITQKQVTAKIASSTDVKILPKAIICIPNADPGYDWLFAYPISGIITAWGGANSHMAIRAGELGIPSVIGAGQALYDIWSNANYVFIDCANKKVEILN